MAKAIDKIQLVLDLKGFSQISGLGKDFEKLKSTVKIADKDVDEFVNTLRQVRQETKLSKNAFQGQIDALKRTKDNVAIGSAEYKKLSAAIRETEKDMKRLIATQGGGRFSGTFNKMSVGAQAAGGAAIGAAASRFLPAGAATGASIGAIAGGPAGALAGAAIGGGIDAIAGAAQFGAESATYAANIQKLQIALKGVTKDQATFEKGLDVIAKTSKRLNVPIAASTKQFTTLSASVLGAGGTIEQAEEVFVGVSNAIKATGGNAEDVQSAIRAMSQIFGKGKVSAEELQGQLGERLAGAVVKFAEANGSSLQKLQKDLRDGTVGLDQIMNFAKKLNKDFAKTAEDVADSSADAGQRLATSLDRLKLAVGTILQPIGAEFQKVFGKIVDAITGAIEAFNEFMGIGLGNAIKKTQKAIENLQARILAAEERGNDKLAKRLKTQLSQKNANLAILTEGLGEGEGNTESNLPDATTPPNESTINKYKLDLGIITKQEFESLQLKIESKKILDAMKAANKDFSMSQDEIIEKLKQSKNATFNFKEELAKVIKASLDLRTNIGTLVVNSVNKLGDTFADFVMTGKASFKDFTRSVLSDLGRILARYALFKTLTSFISPTSSFGKFLRLADGGVIAQNKIVPYKMGGIIDRPQIFPLANGAALAGEAGPEAIMPLKRGADGKLGVQASGNSNNIVVNVDASNTSAQGNTGQAEMLGKMLAGAVQDELLRQQRPGGLLYR